MKRVLIAPLIVAVLFFASTPAFADRYLVEGKVGYFHPFSDRLRDLHDDGFINYQVEVSYSPFSECNPCWWSNLFAWGSYNYVYDEGETRSGVEDSDIDLQFYNFSLGVKYIQPLPCCLRLYGAIGARYIFFRVDNDDENVDRRERADGLGGVFSIGFLFQPWRCLVVDLFADVTVKRFSESEFSKRNAETPKSVDVSGSTVGIGVGIIF